MTTTPSTNRGPRAAYLTEGVLTLLLATLVGAMLVQGVPRHEVSHEARDEGGANERDHGDPLNQIRGHLPLFRRREGLG